MPTKPQLSKRRILKTALAQIDRVGLSKFSIKNLAEQLGVYPAAITWHVGNKDELITLVSALVFDEVKLPDNRGRSWEEWLRETAHEVRAKMHQHPNLVPLIGSRLGPIIPSLPFVERVMSVFLEAGYDDDHLIQAFNYYVGTILGWVTIELSTPSSPRVDLKKSYEETLDDLDSNLYPALSANRALVSNKLFMLRWESGVENPMDPSFDFVVDMVINGLSRFSEGDLESVKPESDHAG